ncbi:MAG: transketolase [Myxococcota bacterium]
MTENIAQYAINTIRTLSMDAVQKANSGHPGAPMGLAPAAYVLFQRHMRFDPKAPNWIGRDRFVLSNGHASMLLYSMLHLTGYEQMTRNELKNFRQWGSLTPGHPEAELTDGVEVTTGPLGQGFATAVGLAIAEAKLRARFGGVIDHFTFGICSDGDLMEGVSHEAASLAGHLGLGQLIFLYDDNAITIDGATDISFTEDVLARFEAYGWHTDRVADGNDVDAIDAAVTAAKAVAHQPSLIALKTVIGYGSPNKQNSSSAHGAPLGPDEIVLARKQLGWPHTEDFFVPADVRRHMDASERGKAAREAWQADHDAWAKGHPGAAAELARRISGELKAHWHAELPVFEPSAKGMATRASSGKVMERIYAALPELMGGSADLAGSNKTLHKDYGVFSREQRDAQNIHFGVREFGMAAAANGMTLHGGVRGFGATFLVFSDYMRPALRLAALMHNPQLMVFTHDSIGLGEDGPTHQPIEHVMSLRAMPNYSVFRPADANEVRECWIAAIERTSGPSCLVLTRQNVPTYDRDVLGAVGDATRGAYILADTEGAPDAILMSSGSEVAICVEARELLAEEGVRARVVSMPCWETFAEQEDAWREQVLPREVTTRVSIEAGTTFGWERFVGATGVAIGLDRFGASAPYEVLYEELGLTAQAIVDAVKAQR